MMKLRKSGKFHDEETAHASKLSTQRAALKENVRQCGSFSGSFTWRARTAYTSFMYPKKHVTIFGATLALSLKHHAIICFSRPIPRVLVFMESRLLKKTTICPKRSMRTLFS